MKNPTTPPAAAQNFNDQKRIYEKILKAFESMPSKKDIAISKAWSKLSEFLTDNIEKETPGINANDHRAFVKEGYMLHSSTGEHFDTIHLFRKGEAVVSISIWWGWVCKNDDESFSSFALLPREEFDPCFVSELKKDGRIAII
jgi:hypothetical protein